MPDTTAKQDDETDGKVSHHWAVQVHQPGRRTQWRTIHVNDEVGQEEGGEEEARWWLNAQQQRLPDHTFRLVQQTTTVTLTVLS